MSQEKQNKMEQALERGIAMVALDARRPGVAVPPQFRDDYQLRLNFSYRFDPPDLVVNQWGVRATLSFGGSRHPVAVPWSAIFGIFSQRQEQASLFAEDIPPELLQSIASSTLPEGNREMTTDQKAKPCLTPLSSVPKEESVSSSDSPEKTTKRQGCHLRLVK